MVRLNTLDWIALILLIIGGLNWLLFGVFQFDLVATIFARAYVVARIIYVLVGIAAIYVAALSSRLAKKVGGQVTRTSS